MSKSPQKKTFFGRLWRTIVKNNIPLGKEIVKAIDGGDITEVISTIKKDGSLTEIQKQLMLKELEHDVIEMKEITKRWQSDMSSDSWLSKNIRPLSVAFLTINLFIYIILDSSLEGVNISEEWVDLLSSLLLLVYGGYFGTRALEKITHIKKK